MTSDNDGRDDENLYLFVVSYTEDAERKRVEYLFNNWDDGEIEKPDGLARLAADVDHDDLYEKVVSKVPADAVESFELTPVEANVEKEHRVIEENVNAPLETVESFVEYILSKKKAVLQSASRNEYEVYTKKGRAEIEYELTDIESGTAVTITVRGYPPAPAFLEEFFERELTDYAESQQ